MIKIGKIYGGTYPVMLTPYKNNMDVDYAALESLIEWYLEKGCNGLFAVCQSSEMFYLSAQERADITAFVVKKVNGRVPVASSGHIAETLKEQINDLSRVADNGVDCVVLVTNRLVEQTEDDEIVKKNITNILEAVPNVDFGLYECPYPYKRLLSPMLLKWCAETGRFTFFKETSCNIESLKAKIEAVKGSRIKLFNANTETLLESLLLRCAGFSGIMMNIHPQLYVWLYSNYNKQIEKAQMLSRYLTDSCAAVESRMYSLNAKYYLQSDGIPINLNSRNPDLLPLTEDEKKKMCHLHTTDELMIKRLQKVDFLNG